MQDITKPSSKKSFQWKEFCVNVLIANIPASIGIALLAEIGVSGFIVPLLLIFGGAGVVGWIRKKSSKMATWKTVLFALGANVVFFLGIAVILAVI